MIWLTNPQDYNFSRRKSSSFSKLFLTKNYVDDKIFTPELKTEAQRSFVRQSFGLPSKSFVVIMVCRMIWSKGIKQFFDTAKSMLSIHPDIHFLLVGAEESSSPDSVSLAELHQMNTLSNFQWIGFQEDILGLYAASDVALLLSYYKEGGYPRALTEPMSMSIPVVGLDTPDCRGPISHGHDGFLVAKDDVNETTNLISKLYKDEALCTEIGTHARQSILSSFSEARIIDNLFDEALSRRILS